MTPMLLTMEQMAQERALKAALLSLISGSVRWKVALHGTFSRTSSTWNGL